MRKPKWLKTLQSKFEKSIEEYEKEVSGKGFEDCLSCSRKEESILNMLRDKAHENAVDKGFYDCPNCNGTGKDSFNVMGTGDGDCGSCNGTGKEQNFSFPQMIALIHGEVSEALEADRKGRFADRHTYEGLKKFDFKGFDSELKKIHEAGMNIAFETHIKNTVEDELADIVIRVFDTCGYLGIDLDWHVKEKMKYNKTREAKHGKRY